MLVVQVPDAWPIQGDSWQGGEESLRKKRKLDSPLFLTSPLNNLVPG